ncbi:MAG: ADP-ribosylglycohydrolase family protein [Deltaproteobacteria bacterium]|nr:ADP-ribosylglycohydrolase family protein [Deltaproteobacteria bacterium]
MVRALAALDGLSVGDALGECFLDDDVDARQRALDRTLPRPPWRFTDDTEMAIAITEVLAESGHVSPVALGRAFVRRYMVDPDRGYGPGAHRVLQMLRRGIPWTEASSSLFGGQGSMGNGGAMRVAPLGAYFADDLLAVIREARTSARVTHCHLEGQAGAVAAAVGAAYACRKRYCPSSVAWMTLLDLAEMLCPPGATRAGLGKARQLDASTSPRDAARVLGNGSGLLASDTVPFALWCAQRHLDDYSHAIWSTIEGLGDIDTNCAIAGGVVGSNAPPPDEWRKAREPLRFESDIERGGEPLALRDRIRSWFWMLRAPKRANRV